jgi:signal transduction histidine kinase
MRSWSTSSDVQGQPQELEVITRFLLQRLLEISATLSSTLDLKKLLELVINTVTELTHTEAASILLLDPVTSELYFAAASGENAPAHGTVVPLEGSIAGWVVRNGKPIVLDNVQEDTRYYAEIESATRYRTRDMVGVPLIAKGKVIGALEAINRQDQQEYDKQDVALIQVLASQAAVAIENARLFQQTDLIAEFMHELKTPLMGLTSAAEVLGRDPATERSSELIAMIQSETTRLTRMAQDFLDLARLESGRTHIASQPVDLAQLVREVIQLQRSQAEARQMTLATDIPPDLPPLLGDADRLKQVILNLTGNAIKHNEPGREVCIRARLLNGQIVIEIADNGEGIPTEYLSKLFDRFYRVPDREGFSEGTGLGLAIAKRIVEEHGGRIEVKSTAGEGTTVYCYLPVAR